MPITFDRMLCCNLEETISREWLITNGLGGFSAGTVAGILTRMQQGLLVANLEEEITPQLLLAKIDEEVQFDQRTYYLGTNEYRDGTLNPAGFVHLESFRLEEGFPIFLYRLGGIDGILLEKRIWMPRQQNTTFIQYRILRSSVLQTSSGNGRNTYRPGHAGYMRSYNYSGNAQVPLTLTLLPFVAYRAYDQLQYGQLDGYFQVQVHQQQTDSFTEEEVPPLVLPRGIAGCTIHADGKKVPYHMLAIGHPESQIQFIPTGVWYWHFLHRHDMAAGLPACDDLYLAGVVRARLWLDKDPSLTVIVTTEELSTLPTNQKQIDQSYEQALNYQRGLLQTQRYFGEGGNAIQTLPILPFTVPSSSNIQNGEFLQLLYQAGDRLLTRRPLPSQTQSGNAAFFFSKTEHIPTIIPAYYQSGTDTRATLIALPGLTVTTGRYSEAQRILRFIGGYFQQGLLPDHLPTSQQPALTEEDYNNADIALWYFYALDKYLSITHDYELLDELYQPLSECIAWYIRGTYHGIGIDPADGLLRTHPNGRALTWMNAITQGIPVTPRIGKPVEVNALWYNAVSLLYEWSRLLSHRGRINHNVQGYAEQAELCRQHFNSRFWYSTNAYLYDSIDGPTGNDSSLRPNQLLACSLHFAVLDPNKHATVFNVVTQHLLTPYGLRTLAPSDASYRGQLPQNLNELADTLHQGAVWPWLIGPYIDTLLRVGEQLHKTSMEATPFARSDFYKEFIWRRGLQVLEPFCEQMQKHLLGTISTVYSGDIPYQHGPEPASALSIGEILRTYKLLAHLGIQYTNQVISV